jgi:hypothetical protein
MTAEKFLKLKKYPSFNNEGGLGLYYCKEAMIEFAKYHVEQALKAASEEFNSKTYSELILDSYPLTNIK